MGCFLSSPPVTSSQLFLTSSVVSSSLSLPLSFALMERWSVLRFCFLEGSCVKSAPGMAGSIPVYVPAASNQTKTQIKERISNFYLFVQMKKLGKTTFGVDTQTPAGAKVSRVCGDNVR